MTGTTLKKTMGLGAITGMRSMSGAAALAMEHRGTLKTIVGVMAAGEMLVDKTPLVGDRIDPAALAGRALMGAVVGGVVAYEDRANVLLGSLIGASAAVVAAHLAYYARKRLPVSTAVGGLMEDALVMALGTFVASRGVPAR
jgi:uncharacterized membrane protein